MRNFTTVVLLLLLGMGYSAHAQINSFPYNQNFETLGQGPTGCGQAQVLSIDWTNDTNDDIDWVSDANGTGSSNTGPTANGGADHNPGVSGGIYMYTEASGCVFDTANLISPMVQTDPNAPNLFLNFWYHEYGNNINVLYVDTRLVMGGTPGAWVPLDTLMDPSLNQWREAQYDLTSFVGDTFQVRMRGVTGSSFGSDLAIDDISFFSLFQNDAGVISVDNPINPVTVGPNNIDVSIQNFGADSLRNTMIGWSFNGAVQTPFSWTGGPLANNQTAGPITIGNFNIPSGLHEICAWTFMPNMMADSSAGNDTTCITVCTPLSGVYTLGGPGADFADFTEAGSILSSCGINANTIVNVAPGTYMEEFILDHVPGTGPGATLTINGGDTSLVYLNGASGPTVYLNGTDYTTIKNMTISAAGTTDAYGVQLRDTATGNTIDSCRIMMNLGTNTSDCIGVSASNTTASSFTEGQNALWTTVSNCHIIGGEKGIHFEGQNAMRNVGNRFMDNWIDQAEDYGFYMDDQDSMVILRNRITGLRSTNADGIFCFDIQMFNISENMAMDVPDWGIYIADGNYALDGTPTSRAKVINNMISSRTDYGAYFDDFEMTDIWHNTFGNTSTFSGGMRINDFTGLDIQNNIFYSTGDFAYECDEPMTNTPNVIDYNNYYAIDTSKYIDDGFAVYTSLANWQIGQPTLNINSNSGDPVFVGGIANMHVLSPVANDNGNNTLGIMIDVDGDARPASPSTVVDMGADEYTPLANDAVAIALLEPGSVSCGDSNTAIVMVISNYGTTPITSLPITIDVSGGIVQTLNFNYTGNLMFNQVDTVTVGTINTYGGAVVDITGWVSLSGDQNPSNDSLGTTTHTFVPIVPQASIGVGCGVDSAYIYGASWPGAGYSWYANMTDTIPISSGDSFLVPSIMAQSTYYVQYASNQGTLTTTFAGGNGCGGGNVFDVTMSSSVQLTGVSVNTSVGQGQTFQVTVHLLDPGNGGGIANATNAAIWASNGTSVGPFTGTSAGAGNPSFVDFGGMNLNLAAGQTYGMYVEFPANYTNGAFVYANADMSIQTGIGLCGSFSGPNNPRSFNGTLHYGTSACSNIRIPVTAITAPGVSVNIGNDTTLCANSFALDAGNPGLDFSWSNGDITQVSNVTMSGIYSVLVTDTSGCDDSDTIDLTLNGVPAVNLGADFLLCDGATDTLDAGNPGASYMWSTSGTGQLEIISMAGTVTVQVTDSNNCIGTDTVIVTTGQTPASAFTFAVGGAGLAYTFTDASTGTPATYSWNFGDGSPASTMQNPVHTYAMAGSYTVTLTVTNACGTHVSTQSVTVVSIEQTLGGGVVSLYPNPNNGQFNIEFNGLDAFDVNLRIMDVKGQVVLERKIDEQGSFVQEVDITRFAKGMYLMQLTADGEQILQRVVVK